MIKMSGRNFRKVDKWIVPFKGRLPSCSSHQNFIAKIDNIYVMDNHRAALWCWLQELDSNSKVGFIHIDMHWDCVDTVSPTIWRDLEKKPKEMTIEEYLGAVHPGEPESIKLFRWDNYIPPFFHFYSNVVERSYAACHGVGTSFPFNEEIRPHNLLQGLENILESGNHKRWIVNLDCDYFFSCGKSGLLFHPEVIKGVAKQLANLKNSGQLAVMTIALSPECCGTWKEAEEVTKIFTDELGLDFILE